jgi:hypothetical protein
MTIARKETIMTSNHERVARVVNKLFDVLQEVEVKVALDALARVTKEFQQAQNEPEIPSRFRDSLNTNKHH